MSIESILKSKNKVEKLALFRFSPEEPNDEIILKFNIWSRYFFSQYFESEDALFHNDINTGNLDAYKGNIDYFVDVAFRGAGKDVKTKLFVAYTILNDKTNKKKYYKILTEDVGNAKQVVTDIYNMFVNPRVAQYYPNTFEKSVYKREETMAAFTTTNGIKVIADTVGTEQRGAIQEETRPDFIWFNDWESRKTLRSIVITKSVHDNMEEARTALQKGGCAIYTCNYISEMGNVHRILTEKLSERKRILIVPILKDNKPTWDRYTIKDIENTRKDDDDFAGERMCVKPDTLIQSEKGLIAIDKLKIGDLVWTHKNRLQKIKTVFQSQAENLFDITVNGKTITITKNHPILVKRNNLISWLSAGELNINDLIVEVRLVKNHMFIHKIEKITPSNYKGLVFNLEVENDHSYLTETLTLHNCKPDASKDIYFDREVLDKMEVREPIKDIAGFKIYKAYDPSHRYAGGHDIAGGVGLDSSTSVFIDFSTVPAQVVGTFASNTILPEAFGDEIYDEANHFGGCLVAPENNKFDQTILKAKQLGANIYKMKKGQTLKTIAIQAPTIYGWTTNSLTKSKMMADFRKAVNDGLVALNDKDLIQEVRSYTRNDLIDNQPDPRDVANATRHYDLLTGATIAWQMKDFCEIKLMELPEHTFSDESVKVNPAE